jgi:anaerobic magnesium-protoporphyrin IX monomethyl ester cyclase
MNVILADPPTLGFGKLQPSPNLGILSLSAYLKQTLPGTRVHYIPERYPLSYHADMVRRHNVSVYGISFTSYSALRAYRTVKALKDAFPRLMIVCGGPHPSAVPAEVARQPGVDACVIGEGEETFAELVQKLADRSYALQTTQGIAYTEKGRYVVNPPRRFRTDIEEFPYPDRTIVRDGDFAGLPLHRSKPTAEIVVTRGCPYRCIFCSNPVFRPEEIKRSYEDAGGGTLTLAAVGRSLRMRSAHSVAKEAAMLYSLGYREIYLHSDELNCDEAWAIDICDALADLGYEDLYFQTNLRADKVSENLADALKRANMWLVRLGIESSSPRVMAAQKKKVSLSDVERACWILSSRGLKVFGYFMMFQFWDAKGKLECETAEEVAGTIDFAETLARRDHLHYIGWAVATPMQGAAMYTTARRHGLIDETFYPSQRWHLCRHIRSVRENEFNRLLKRGLRLQARLALKNGGVGWSNWRRILAKSLRLAFGNSAPKISDFNG